MMAAADFQPAVGQTPGQTPWSAPWSARVPLDPLEWPAKRRRVFNRCDPGNGLDKSRSSR